MNKMLPHLESVDLRNVWATEFQDFTPWLAKEENLARLSEVVKMNLQLPQTECSVGIYRSDILCHDFMLNRKVLIENQLEITDHFTYAANLKASCIIWISKRFTKEHRAVLNWLNENLESSIHFFGIEMELWKIENSMPAPNFNVIVQPKEWFNTIKEAKKK